MDKAGSDETKILANRLAGLTEEKLSFLHERVIADYNFCLNNKHSLRQQCAWLLGFNSALTLLSLRALLNNPGPAVRTMSLIIILGLGLLNLYLIWAIYFPNPFPRVSASDLTAIVHQDVPKVRAAFISQTISAIKSARNENESTAERLRHSLFVVVLTILVSLLGFLLT